MVQSASCVDVALQYATLRHSKKVKLTPIVAKAEDNITAAAAALYGSAEIAVVKGAKAMTAGDSWTRGVEGVGNELVHLNADRVAS
jgi:hypothetical protein